ncbi:KilA-N domain-containing protein [Komagataeibacter oboediens]|uniref:KilA-N domain-containing protein n=1 Tax=Komagataeibacter oboediens TaxID=65958 RepID=UPI0012F51A4A|nr:KilA-N domain-containing protein [Komagataeibacter oboediens]
MTHNTGLTILSTAIRQDAEGRYCLNDCHKAAGAPASKGPNEWAKNSQTEALIAELRSGGISPDPKVTVTTGPNDGRGTYGSEEVILAYAQWISPAFHVQCLRALLALMKGDIPSARPKRIRKPPFDVAFERCLRVASHFTHLDENQRLLSAARGTKELSGVNPLELMGITSIAAPTQDNYLTPTQIGKQIGLSPIATNRLITATGHQVKSDGSSASSDYTMTEAGAKYGRMFDTTRKHGKGSQQQLKWSPDLVSILRTAMIAGEGKAAPFARSPEPATT